MELNNGNIIIYNKNGKEKFGQIGLDFSIGKKFVVLTNGKVIKIKNISRVWKPKFEEKCIFFNNNGRAARLSKFQQMGVGKGKEGLYKDCQGNYFHNCLPFKKNFFKRVSKMMDGIIEWVES